jgi:hypothetical protein
MRSTIITTAAAAIAALSVATPAALASKPDVVDRFSEPYSGSVECSVAGSEFTMVYSGIQHWTAKLWLDDSGESVRESFHVRFRETSVNTSTQKTVLAHGSSTEDWDFAAGTRTINGAVFMGSDQGVGTFIHDSGRLILDLETDEALSMSGPHEGYENGIDETICAAVA